MKPIIPGAPRAITFQEAQTIAEAGVKAIEKMAPDDRTKMLDQLAGTPQAIIDGTTLSSSPTRNRMLKASPDQLLGRVREGANPVSQAVHASGARIGDLKSALQDLFETHDKESRDAATRALAEMAVAAKTTPEEFQKLVGRLGLLSELKGQKELSMLPREVRAKLNTLTNGNLKQLADDVAHQLRRLAYAEARDTGISKGAL